ncbi:MAG: tetratricopeptide repeat protein [Alphaproteobacteria bacterium]
MEYQDGTTGTRAALEQAYAHHQAGRADEAERCYRRILADQPNNGVVLNLLGVLLAQTGRLDDAADLLNQAFGAGNDFAEAHHNLGKVRILQGNAEAAVACFERALEINPGYADACNDLGHALSQLGRHGDAAAAFQRVIELVPDRPDGHINLGTVYQELGRLDDAVACLNRALEISPDCVEAHVNLGIAVADQGRIDDALEAYGRALAIDADCAEALFNQGNAFERLARLDDAADGYRKAIEIRPDYIDAYNNLGHVLMDQRKAVEAESIYRQALEIAPDDAELYYNFATIHRFFVGDPELHTLESLAARPGVSADGLNRLKFALGKAHDDIGRHDEAFKYFQRANGEMAVRQRFDQTAHQRLVDTIKASFAARPSPSDGTKEADKVPVFVIGPSRSGKSLVESVLANHPDVLDIGEHCKWGAAFDQTCDRHGITAPFPQCMDELTAEHITDMGAAYMAGLTRNSPAQCVFVITSPEHLRYLGLIREALPAAKMIFCRRDPLDTCLAIYFKRFEVANPYAYDLSDIAAHHTAYQGMMSFWQEKFPSRILPVDYEDMVSDPHPTAAKLFAFVGLDGGAAATGARFYGREIGHARHYAAHLGPLRRALGLPAS